VADPGENGPSRLRSFAHNEVSNIDQTRAIVPSDDGQRLIAIMHNLRLSVEMFC
jgi:hypothetical protein